MPTYRITAPDGRTFKVTGDGTAEEALAHIQSQYAPPKDAAPPADRAAARQAADPSEYDPQSPEFRAKYGAQGSDFQNAMAGAGKAVVDTGRGLKQLGAEVLDRIAPRQQTLSTLVTGQKSRGDELRAQTDEIEARDADLMNTKAGLAGYVGSTIATTLLPAGAVARAGTAANLTKTAAAARAFANPATYKAAAAAGALQGAIRPVGEDDSRTLNVATGAALGVAGNAVANTAGRIAQPVKKTLDAGARRAVKVLQDAGVPLDTVQLTGSSMLGKIKQGLSSNPYTAGGQEAAQKAQTAGFTRATLRTIGENADTADEQVLGAARDRIGKVFNDVSTKYSIDMTPQLTGQLKGLAARAKRLLPGETNQIGRQVENILDGAQSGSLPGQMYQAIKGELDQLAKQRDVSPLARELRDLLDDGLEKATAGTDDFARLKEARSQYGRLLKIADSADETGAVTPAKLWQQFNTKGNRAQAKFGKGDRELVKLAVAGRRILTDKAPNSGTAARVGATLAVPAAAYAVSSVAGGDPVESLKWAGASVIGPKALQALINNPKAAARLSEGAKNQLLRQLLEATKGSPVVRQLPVATGAALNAE